MLLAAVVSRFLAQQGIPRSESWSTAIRGWRDYSPGFTCRQSGDAVVVEFRNSNLSSWGAKMEKRFLLRVIDAIGDKWKTEYIDSGYYPAVRVTRGQ
jgi:hypothetical protein